MWQELLSLKMYPFILVKNSAGHSKTASLLTGHGVQGSQHRKKVFLPCPGQKLDIEITFLLSSALSVTLT